MEELLTEWKSFNLSDREKESHIFMEPEELLRINGQLNRCLTGKLMSNRPISKVAIKNALSGAWKTREDFEVNIIGRNMFLF